MKLKNLKKIKECESNPSKKKISEAESSKKKIEQKIKMVRTIIKTEDDTFMLESYEDLKNELNKRLNIVIKRQEKMKDKNNFNELFSSSNSHRKEKKSKKQNNDYEDEEINFKNTIKLSSDESSNSLDDEFAKSEKQLNESTEKVFGFLGKIPIIGKVCKERCCLMCFVIVIFVIGIYVIFFKKNNSNNS